MTAAITRPGPARAERPRRIASWALAARLARREVRRRKGRTALVVALIAIPVIAMTIGSVVFRTTRAGDAQAEAFHRYAGAADALVWGVATPPAGAGTFDPATLPAGSRIVQFSDLVADVVTPADRHVSVRFTDLPLADPITRGMVTVTAGRVPAAPDEVLLSPGAAADLDVAIGDILTLRYPSATYRVVGFGRDAQQLDMPLMVVGQFDFSRLAVGGPPGGLVDLPDGVSPAEVWGSSGAGPTTAFWPDPASDRSAERRVDLAIWGWVAGALALTVMGIIIAAAFATSGRRQLVTLGQLASNGAGQALLRRTLALQGAWSGTVGALGGVGAGLVLILPQHGLLQRASNHTLPGMRVAPLDLAVVAVTGVVAATVAALVPARALTEVPVLSALAGRPRLGRIPRWLVPLGLLLFGGGVALVALAAAARARSSREDSGNLFAAVAVVGGLGVLFGMCCSTPGIISVLGPLGERMRGTARLSARSLARARTRSAAIVTAITAAGALSIGAGAVHSTNWHADDSYWNTVPALTDRMVLVQAYDNGPPANATIADNAGPVLPEVPEEVLTALRTALPAAAVVPMRAGADPEPVSDSNAWRPTTFLIADEALMDAMALDPIDRRALADGVVLTGVEQPGEPASTTPPIPSDPGALTLKSFAAWPSFRAATQFPLVSPERANELGLMITTPSAVLMNDQPLTTDQRRAVDEVRERFAQAWSPFQPLSERPDVELNITLGDSGSDDTPKELIDGLIVGGALLFVLAVVVVGLALSAAESRDERDVLLAVGAPPRAMRRVSAQKAVLLAAIGGVLAVPTGFLPVAVVMAQTSDNPIRFPWLVALGCLVAVPVLVGAATFTGAAITQRVRPVRMSTVAVD